MFEPATGPLSVKYSSIFGSTGAVGIVGKTVDVSAFTCQSTVVKYHCERSGLDSMPRSVGAEDPDTYITKVLNYEIGYRI